VPKLYKRQSSKGRVLATALLTYVRFVSMKRFTISEVAADRHEVELMIP